MNLHILSVTSVLWDITAVLALCVISLALGIFIRMVIVFSKPKEEPDAIKTALPKKPARIVPKTRSIVINPDEIGRIYVRKSD